VTATAPSEPVPARSRRVVGRLRARTAQALRALHHIFAVKPFGAIEGVQSELAGVVHITGWAYRRNDPIEAVVVVVDGEPLALATLGGSRPDVARTFANAPGSAAAGWTANVPIARRVGERVRVEALATTHRGLTERLGPVGLTVPPSARVGHIDRPASGTIVRADALTIEGWALADGGLMRVEVSIDGHAVGPARPFSLPRPDLASSPLPGAPMCGFTHTIDLGDGAPGRRIEIDAEVVGRDGRRTRIGPVKTGVAPVLGQGTIAAEVESMRRRTAELRAQPIATDGPAVRLFVVTHQLDLGGGQLYLLELLRGLLAELDVSCLVVAPSDGPLRVELERLGAIVHLSGDYPVHSAREYEAMVFDLATVARDRGCNFVLINTMSAAIGADVARRLAIPSAWAIHESYPLNEFWLTAYGLDRIDQYVRDQATRLLGETTAVVFESLETRSLFAPYGAPERFVHVPYGIDFAGIDRYPSEDRAAFRSTAGIDDDATVILCVGTYEPRKGQAALAVAFGEVAPTFLGAELVLVGDNGTPYAAALHELVDALEVSDRIHLVPVVPDIYAWYALADVLVSASDIESMPRSALEAMAFGVPVAAASVFGLTELIEDGVTGMLFEPRDLGALTGALSRFLAMSPSERAAIGAAGARHVRDHHDASGYIGAYDTLIRGLIDQPSALPTELLGNVTLIRPR
jgi:D-inositol-3-phosphate glycosyltransferase